ncbi:hypothetical protein Hanom_Chr09g00856951 [Helianthus anomalus]
MKYQNSILFRDWVERWMEHVRTVDLPYFLKLRTLLPQMSLFQRHKPTRNHRLALFYTYSCQSSVPF